MYRSVQNPQPTGPPMPLTQAAEQGELVQEPAHSPLRRLIERVFGAKSRRVETVCQPVEAEPIDKADFRVFQAGGLDAIREGINRRGKRARRTG